jgi:hypothetical protein
MRLWLNNLHFFGLDISKISICSVKMETKIFEEF